MDLVELAPFQAASEAWEGRVEAAQFRVQRSERHESHLPAIGMLAAYLTGQQISGTTDRGPPPASDGWGARPTAPARRRGHQAGVNCRRTAGVDTPLAAVTIALRPLSVGEWRITGWLMN
ncbi:hypothetical protein GCM10009864_60090 [Streptomyces lunalinharesii]|uniref:Uncharacterized protein n=1 Tax=Streptomyces lunalinharesii TaxID=333384 RepID=A0ABP6EZ84_9ACTN